MVGGIFLWMFRRLLHARLLKGPLQQCRLHLRKAAPVCCCHAAEGLRRAGLRMHGTLWSCFLACVQFALGSFVFRRVGFALPCACGRFLPFGG